MISALASLLLFLMLVGSARALGSLLTRRFSLFAGMAERAVFTLSLGIGILAYGVLFFGLLRLLNPTVLWALLLLPFLCGIVLLFLNARASVPGTRSVPDRYPPAAFRRVCGGLLAGLGLFTLIGALAPPGGNEWDALSYHLAVPKLYLQEGRIFYLPWMSHSNFPFTLQMLYTLMLGLGSVGAAKLCHWLCGVLLALSVYSFAARHITPADRGKTTGLVAALIVAATPIVLWEASVAYVDLATALFTWLSLYALFNALAPFPPSPTAQREDRERGPGGEGRMGGEGISWLVVSALMMGLALGTKYTVLGFWGLLLVGILVARFRAAGGGARRALTEGALWGGVSLLVAAPWYVKTWLYTGNPVYPFFYGLFGGRYWSAENAAEYTVSQAQFGLGKSALDLLLAPWQATMPATAARFTEYGFGLSPVYVGVLVAAPLFLRRLSPASSLLALFALGVYVFWFFLMQQTRYLIPALPALAVVCAEALVALWDLRRAARWFGAALVALSAAWGLYLAAVGIAAPALPVVTGQATTREYVAGTLWMRGLMPAIEYINRETPTGAKVALFGETRGFYLDRPYLWATPNHSTLLPWDRYASVDDWLDDFRWRGYTTLLVNARFLPRGGDTSRWFALLREAITDGRVTLGFEEAGVQVYHIP